MKWLSLITYFFERLPIRLRPRAIVCSAQRRWLRFIRIALQLISIPIQLIMIPLGVMGISTVLHLMSNMPIIRIPVGMISTLPCLISNLTAQVLRVGLISILNCQIRISIPPGHHQLRPRRPGTTLQATTPSVIGTPRSRLSTTAATRSETATAASGRHGSTECCLGTGKAFNYVYVRLQIKYDFVSNKSRDLIRHTFFGKHHVFVCVSIGVWQRIQWPCQSLTESYPCRRTDWRYK